MGDGYIFRNWWNDARGWAVIVKMDSGIAFEYQHMQSECTLAEGSRVSNGQFIGVEGTTGQITGLHLHMEMQDLSSGRDWDYTATLDSYMNPADFMRNSKYNWYKLDLRRYANTSNASTKKVKKI